MLEFIAAYLIVVGFDLEVWICHSYVKANVCADALANIAPNEDFTLMLYEHCPIQINMLFLTDLTGVCTPRIVKR